MEKNQITLNKEEAIERLNNFVGSPKVSLTESCNTLNVLHLLVRAKEIETVTFFTLTPGEHSPGSVFFSKDKIHDIPSDNTVVLIFPLNYGFWEEFLQ